MWALVRIAVVLAATGLELGFALPDFIRPVEPIGDLGFSTTNNVVTGIVPGGPAARAHIAVGDSIGFSSQEDRFRFFDPSSSSYLLVHPGDSDTFAVEHNGTSRRVTLVATRFSEYPAWLVPLRVFVESFWLLLAAFLVLRRPSVMTWSFFVFSIFPNIAPLALGPLILPVALVVLSHVSFEVYAAISQSAALIFILSLGPRPVPRWHWIAGIITVPLFVILNLPIAIQNLLFYFWSIPHSAFDFVLAPAYGFVAAAWAVTALSILGVICAQSSGKERQRVTWILIGFVIYSLASVAVAFLPRGTPLIVFALLWTLFGALPVCVFYAILKHRLIDISFFINRALVYAIISGGIIAVFGLIDWVFTKRLSDSRLGTLVEIAGAIAFGLSFSYIHAGVDHLVDRLFFRRKHVTEARLRKLATELPQASSDESIARSLVDEPFTALELASAALFKHQYGAGFVRVRARGWGERALEGLSDDDLLLLHVQNNRSTSVLDELLSRNHEFPQGPAKPDVVLPIFVRSELVALALYGSHQGGEHLDSDEIQMIGELAAGASAAYAHFEALELRREAEAARSQMARMKVELLRSENSASALGPQVQT
jgi:hypothetical protein